MATEAYVHGLGTCRTCGEPLLSVGSGDSGGTVMSCIKCEAKKPSMKPGVNSVDPGEAEMRRVLGISGVSTPKVDSKPSTIKQETQKIEVKAVSLESIIVDLESLPMPKSMKQFKAINKAITTLKKVLAEN